jgi:hypothetical protein
MYKQHHWNASCKWHKRQDRKICSRNTDLKNLLSLNLQKCFYELNRLNRFINSVEDSELRQILTYRYISGITWQQIAFNIGEHDEQYPRQKHNKFLEGSEKVGE